MNLAELQTRLKSSGRYGGRVDGLWGLLTEGAILLALTDGPDTALADADFEASAKRLGVQAAAIRAFWKTEANGAGFEAGRPKILPERHRFSRLTGGRFDARYPELSYPRWGTRPYPRTQDDRYRLLLSLVRLDVDAGFAACSYGAPQILGENARACGYATPFDFAEAMARDERTQLRAFEAFVVSAGIVPDLRRVSRALASWAPVARRYNGTAYRENRYDEKMLTHFIQYGGR